MSLTAMISGHLNLTEEEFKEHYEPLLWRAVRSGHAFVVGDAPGADAMAQEFLSQRLRRISVTVYHCARFPSPRNNIGDFPVIAVGDSQTAKDKAMTLASDYDIAWVRPGREDSGTARNLARRQKLTGGAS